MRCRRSQTPRPHHLTTWGSVRKPRESLGLPEHLIAGKMIYSLGLVDMLNSGGLPFLTQGILKAPSEHLAHRLTVIHFGTKWVGLKRLPSKDVIAKPTGKCINIQDVALNSQLSCVAISHHCARTSWPPTAFSGVTSARRTPSPVPEPFLGWRIVTHSFPRPPKTFWKDRDAPRELSTSRRCSLDD